MAQPRPIIDIINNLEFELAKHKAVLEQFPNAKANAYGEFLSKDVNQKYTKFDFERNNYGIYVIPYCEVSFTHNQKEETVKISSKPRRSRLVYLDWDSKTYKNIIKFSRLSFNLKQNNFKDDLINDCRIEILNFVKNNSKYAIDNKHLEPRLKKLLIFT